MNIYSLPALIVFVTSIILGVYILRKDPRDRFNRSFFIFALAVALWFLGKFMKRANLDLGSLLQSREDTRSVHPDGV